MAQRIRREQQAGFTVVEIILFLAVTGALIAALLGGVGIALNNQRYQDAVQSFKTLLQAQFTELDSISNEHDGTWTCDTATAKTSQSPDGTGAEDRGRSQCYIVGRYVTINNADVTISEVIGSDSSTKTTKTNPTDIDVMAGNYHYNLSSVRTETDSLSWGTQISWPVPTVSGPHDGAQAQGTSRAIAILIMRSPDSGITYLFTADPTANQLDHTKVQESDLLGMMKGGNVVPGQGDRLICLESNGLSSGGNMGFYIEAYATNASAIQTRSNDTKLAGGNATC